MLVKEHWMSIQFRTLVSHAFVFVYIREFWYYILRGQCLNERDHCKNC